ncbi:MAG: response regulator [Gemmatimonadota bacterium]
MIPETRGPGRPHPAHKSPESPGDHGAVKISGFSSTSEIYRGRKTVIYRARRDKDGKPVVLKTLRGSSADEAARFRHEYEIATLFVDVSGVSHAESFERYGSSQVMVMSDEGGESLRTACRGRRLSNPEFLAIARQLAATIGAVHERSIVHKDINTNNILWNRVTGRVELIDFGLASRLSREHQSAVSPHLLEGTLAYVSPEQTGRMNRTIDYRTDFYSLGVTFYELLTGTLPFTTNDPVELVHHHIARVPPPPHEVATGVEPALSAVVMKLLSKTAEERYQSAGGLARDLEEIAAALGSGAPLTGFVPGRADVTDRLRIPQTLYGRTGEVAALLAAVERVAAGGTALVLVGGYAGIGKSSLIQEIHKPVVRQQAFFVSGKCDQYHRNIPYASVLQAFRQLVGQLLTESAERVDAWRVRLSAALGANAQILIDVIPELEPVLGRQPAPAALGPIESQNRFNLLIERFIDTFARPEHPLVVFLDDLQWADPASLKLVERLTTDRERKYLCLVGAYRANEVSESHPLLLTANKVKASGLQVEQIMLHGLGLEDATQLISDALRCDHTRAQPLARIVVDKTGGNPFFLNQFLVALHNEGLLTFNHETGRWVWDPDQIRTRRITDNVVELMAGKIRKLRPSTQNALKLAACIGSRFDLKTLATVSQLPQRQVAADLWEAITEELIHPIGDDYRLVAAAETESDRSVAYEFLHDRVQQAAHSLIPDDEEKTVRARVGRLLLENSSPSELDERIFEIVNQLNFGAESTTDSDEKYRLASLNLNASRKARGALAWDAAARYLAVAISILPPDAWSERYQLAFECSLEYATALALSGDLDGANRAFAVVYERAKSAIERGSCCDVQSEVLQCAGKAADAYSVANRGLALFGRQLPDDADTIKAETERLMAGLLTTEGTERLSRLEATSAEEALLISRLYDRAIISCYFSQPQNLGLVISKSLDAVLELGLTPQSGTAIIWFAMISAMQGHTTLALSYARMAVDFVDRFNDPYVKGRVDMLGYCMCLGWTYTYRASEQSLHETYLLCHSTGDLQYASYALLCKYIAALLQGQDCRAMLEYCRQWRDYCQRYVPLELGQARIRVREMERLMGEPSEPVDADAIIAEYEQAQNFTDVCESLMELARVGTIFGDHAASYALSRRAEPMIINGAAGNLLLIAAFHHSLGVSAARLFEAESDPERKREFGEQLDACLARLRGWATLSPDNFASYCSHIEAERARVDGKEEAAVAAYLSTIRHAHDHGYLMLQAMAHESLAVLYGTAGLGFARAHNEEAHSLWLSAGALGKASQVSGRAGMLPVARTSLEGSALQQTVSGVALEVLDFASVIKAAQTLSSEIVLEKLLEKVMASVIESAAAESGFLILREGQRLLIEAESHVECGVAISPRTDAEDSGRLPASIIRYVARTTSPVVLVDAGTEGLFTSDPYITENETKSVLCMPLMLQGEVTGLLYLENNLTPGAFTEERMRVLHVLASQAAIAIENARLIARLREQNLTLEDRISERTRALQDTNRELEAARLRADAANEAKSRFLASMSHELRTPLNAIIGYSEMLQEEAADIGPSFTEDLQKITVAGKHLLGLINAVLDLSKIEAGKMDFVLEEFLLPELLRDIEAVIRPLASKNGNRLVVVSSDMGRMRADPMKVRQVLFNLLSNSCKFTSNGVVTLTVDREMADEREWCVFAVHDTGIGISPSQAEELFQEFTQVGTETSRTYGGTGLGLALSRRLCRIMGGDITMESIPGEGSTFTVRLPALVNAPVTEEHLVPATTTTVNGRDDRPGGEGAAGTVLVIDDEKTVRELMHRFLTREGYRVIGAANGPDGIRLAREKSPDVITLDVLMPEMDGWAVLSALKADEKVRDIPVIMLSILDDKHAGYALGANDYLLKPIDRDLLAAALRRFRRDKPVLVVDDDPEFRNLLVRLLGGEGFRVSEADDGLTALQRLANERPGAILLDLMMPSMNGFEFLAAIREKPEWHDIPVMVITARDLTPNDRRRLNGCVEGVLAKSAYTGEALMREVRDLVRGSIDAHRSPPT